MSEDIANKNTEPEGTWEFFLSNIKLMAGDCSTISSDGRTKTLDSVEFSAADRTWRLTDVMMRDRNDIDESQPFPSGRLTTSRWSGDSEEDLCELVDDMGFILSIAMSRTVSWTSCVQLDASGTKVHGTGRKPHLTPFSTRLFEPVTNGEAYSLKQLLESGIPIVGSDREWFRRTLDMVLQAQLHDFYEVRCAMLFMLLDRLSTRILGDNETPEIDSHLNERSEQPGFKEALHFVLKHLSPDHWTEDRTEQVIEMAKQWNSGPSYVAKVKRACISLRLPEPSSKVIKARHKLIHVGDLATRKGDNYSTYLEVDHLVLTMTLRLLGYESEYFHPHKGDGRVLILSDQPTD